MIPYGMFALTTCDQDNQNVGAGTVNWVTETSFQLPLLAVGVGADSGVHQHITDTGVFSVNIKGQDQRDMAFNFLKSHEREGDTIGGESFEVCAETGCPSLISSPAWGSCKMVGQVAQGDHPLFVGEVVEAGVRRDDDQTILMRDHNLFYGG